MKHRKAYIKQHIDNDKWVFVLKDDDSYLAFNSVDEAENYLYLNHRDDSDHYMIVTYD